MNKRLRSKLIITTILIFIGIFALKSEVSFANSMEPPSIIIVVPGASEDLEVFIVGKEGLISSTRKNFLSEAQFSFYKREIPTTQELTFLVKNADQSFELKTTRGVKRYHLVYTVDPVKQTLETGTTFIREVRFVAARVGFTLIIEGIIFCLFKFRDRRSWIAFFTINLTTQGILNIWIGVQSMFMSYLIIGLVVGEVFVLITELILFNLFIKEQTISRRSRYVALANFASLILGGYLLMWLPI